MELLIMTRNEIRGKCGLPPIDDPKADKLVNSNMGNKTDIDNYVGNAQPEETDESSE